MRNKKIVFVALMMIAIVALIQIPIPPVLADQKTETPLYPVSGSDVDNRAFKSGDYVIADGFAVAITMDLPVDKMQSTHTRVAFAVGLGNQTEYHDPNPPYNDWYYTPYVNKMWLKVEGDGDYEPSTGAIVDNTGTGGSSTPDFWTVLDLVFVLFDVYQIANFLMEVHQAPPSPEWKQELHSVTATVRQTGNPHKDPRLQTASAWFDSYFKRDGWNTLTITAGAEIWLREELCDVVGCGACDYYIGTYQVSYQVRILVGSGVLVALAKDQDGNWLKTADVYVDGQWRNLTGSTFTVGSGTHTVRTNDFWDGTGYRYGFTNWEDGSTSPNRTVNVPAAVIAYFTKKYCPGDCNGDGVVNELDLDIVEAAMSSSRGGTNWDSRADMPPCDGFIDIYDAAIVSLYLEYFNLIVLAQDQYGNSLTTGYVYIDGQYKGRTGSTFTVMAGTRQILATDFWESGDTGNRYGFKNWTDGSTANPRTMWLDVDTTIKANFKKKWCPGDVNGDGNVTLADVGKVKLVFSGQITDPMSVRQCDVNGDGKVTLADVGKVKINYGRSYPGDP
jgi:hypothetical protein